MFTSYNERMDGLRTLFSTVIAYIRKLVNEQKRNAGRRYHKSTKLVLETLENQKYFQLIYRLQRVSRRRARVCALLTYGLNIRTMTRMLSGVNVNKPNVVVNP